jgi:DNA-binding NarL/FixJ family response regulator
VLHWALLDDSNEEAAKEAREWLLRALEGFRATSDRKGEVTSLIALAYRRNVSSRAHVTNARDSYVSFLEEIRRLRATEHRLTRVSERPRMEALALLSIDLYCRTNGWYEIALQRATQALALADEARDTRVAVMARIALGETERLLGRFPRAIELAERAIVAIDTSDRTGPSLGHQRDAAVQSLALAYALAGHRHRAIETAREAAERTSTTGPAARRAEVLTGLAEVAEVAGDRDLAVDTAKRALRAATGLVGGIAWDIRAELVLARMALLDGDAGLSLGHASAAAGRLAQRDLPHIALQIAVELARGQTLLAAGFEADARDALASAQQRVVRIADRIIDEALRTDFLSRSPIARSVVVAAEQVGLKTAMVAALNRPADEPDILTRREVEVLRQVAAGLPNREIADQLFISEKTVARHLTNIFTKLDVESRTQAAAWAFRQGIV